MKRIGLFLLLNFLIITSISIVVSIFNLQSWFTQKGINYETLIIFCLLWGMGGSFISLLLSKHLAKKMMGVEVIDPRTLDPNLRSLVEKVHFMAKRAGIRKMPEVGIYESPEVNAFATGASKNSSLLAVSTGLLSRMDEDAVEGVLGHEIAHISNGDMVTMALLQGVINSFVLFLARIIAHSVSKRDNGSTNYAILFLVQIGIEMILMILGSILIAWFSRHREFRADEGGAKLAGRNKMIHALQSIHRYGQIQDPEHQPKNFQVMKISGLPSLMSLFSTHPPLLKRIKNLQK